MLKFKVVKKGKGLEKRINNLLKVNGEYVETGHFRESGVHQPSGMKYTDLMMLHHTGVPSKNIPRREVLTILWLKNRKLKTEPEVKRALRQWASKGYAPKSTDVLLDRIGSYLAKEEKAIFGSQQALMPGNSATTVALKGKNSPLVDTGDLRDKVSYRKSTDKAIKKG